MPVGGRRAAAEARQLHTRRLRKLDSPDFSFHGLPVHFIFFCKMSGQPLFPKCLLCLQLFLRWMRTEHDLWRRSRHTLTRLGQVVLFCPSLKDILVAVIARVSELLEEHVSSIASERIRRLLVELSSSLLLGQTAAPLLFERLHMLLLGMHRLLEFSPAVLVLALHKRHLQSLCASGRTGQRAAERAQKAIALGVVRELGVDVDRRCRVSNTDIGLLLLLLVDGETIVLFYVDLQVFAQVLGDNIMSIRARSRHIVSALPFFQLLAACGLLKLGLRTVRFDIGCFRELRVNSATSNRANFQAFVINCLHILCSFCAHWLMRSVFRALLVRTSLNDVLV
mmetsp:Transcript_91228/g.261087  ORF Transcript_91228/g.261087 Transcript_91228/m.261087 type:complete len:338 (+) Transcript_91228:543-1556(+)